MAATAAASGGQLYFQRTVFDAYVSQFMRAVLVAGARPNFVKIKPVLDALEGRGVECLLVHTGQHYDAAMSGVFFDELGLRAPERHLGAGSGTHAQQTSAVMLAFEPILESIAPDVVVVVGDVNSTLACAIVAAKAGCPLAHVEAGLRSGDWTMPEEVNRVVTDRLARFLFAPSPDAVENLRREGEPDDEVFFVGNVMVDTLLQNLSRARRRPILDNLGLEAAGYGLVTLHRPGNVDDMRAFGDILGALGTVARQCPLVFPAHPRTQARLDASKLPSGIRLIDPLGYLDFVCLEGSARLVLTDSGGVQEETTVLGVPCLTLRDNTERPITITEGTNQLVGRDPERIVATALAVLDKGVEPRRPALWDGQAATRIAGALVATLTHG